MVLFFRCGTSTRVALADEPHAMLVCCPFLLEGGGALVCVGSALRALPRKFHVGHVTTFCIWPRAYSALLQMFFESSDERTVDLVLLRDLPLDLGFLQHWNRP